MKSGLRGLAGLFLTMFSIMMLMASIAATSIIAFLTLFGLTSFATVAGSGIWIIIWLALAIIGLRIYIKNLTGFTQLLGGLSGLLIIVLTSYALVLGNVAWAGIQFFGIIVFYAVGFMLLEVAWNIKLIPYIQETKKLIGGK